MSYDSLPNVGNDLIRIHKVITRALDVSLDNIRQGKLSEDFKLGFISYVRSLTILLDSHHAGEDELSFPFWRKRLPEGPFELLIEQHQQMIAHIGEIKQWLEVNLLALKPDQLNKLAKVLFELRKLWLAHIELEETTIGPVSARQYLTMAENMELQKQLSEHGQANSQPIELVMPFIVYNLSRADRVDFIKLLPPILMHQFIPLVWKDAWSPMKPFLLAE